MRDLAREQRKADFVALRKSIPALDNAWIYYKKNKSVANLEKYKLLLKLTGIAR